MTLGHVPPITSTLTLPHCWACQGRFVASGGTDPILIRNEHHVVPRCYGGEDGPTVTLCSADHDLLHSIANRLIAGDDLHNHVMLRGLTNDRASRIAYLANVVFEADRATAGDPNRRFALTMELPPAYRRKMEQLKAATGSRSQATLIRYLIDAEYQRRFPLKVS